VIEATVINRHAIKPLDGKTEKNAAKKTGAVMTVEEHQITGGVGGAVSEYLSENYPVPVKRVRIKDRYVESGAPNELPKKSGLSHNNIKESVKSVLRLRDE
jgi:transketolase